VDGLAVSARFGLLAFQLSPEGSTLIAIDPADATVRELGTVLAGRDIRGAAFDALDNLWAVDAAHAELLAIDPATGDTVGQPKALQAGGELDLTWGADLAFRSDGKAVLAVYDTTFALDPGTGSLTRLFTDPDGTFAMWAGIAFAEAAPGQEDLLLYEVGGTDDIFAYRSGTAKSLVLADIVPQFNAGRGDLAAIPSSPTVFPQLTPALELRWNSEPGVSYSLAMSPVLYPGMWPAGGPPIPSGGLQVTTYLTPSGPMAFFRTIGPATGNPRPRLQIARAVEIAFTTEAGKTYQVQGARGSVGAAWSNVDGPIGGNGGRASLYDLRSSGFQCYRVVAQQ
jgi:hypothetical protein